MAVRAASYITPQQYLEWERKAETKSEYHGGQIVAMAGASWEHNLIKDNLSRHLGNQMAEGPCVVVTSDLRVRVPACDKYYYPDVVVVCSEPQFEDAHADTLLNPTLIVEVLSDTTEKTDREEKFDCYRTLESLAAYVLVAQDRPRVECFTRQSDGSWRFEVAKGLDAVLSLAPIGCTVRLGDIYARVPFPTKQAAERQAQKKDNPNPSPSQGG